MEIASTISALSAIARANVHSQRGEFCFQGDGDACRMGLHAQWGKNPSYSSFYEKLRASMTCENECEIKQEVEAMSPCFPTTIPSNVYDVQFLLISDISRDSTSQYKATT